MIKQFEISSSIFFILLFFLNCNQGRGKKFEDSLINLLLLQALTSSSATNVTTFAWGLAGQQGKIALPFDSATVRGGILTIGGTSVPVTYLLPDPSELLGLAALVFITPILTAETENRSLDLVFVADTGVTYTGSFEYYILPPLTQNVPNNFNRKLGKSSSTDPILKPLSIHYYKFKPIASINILNVSGYTGNSTVGISATLENTSVAVPFSSSSFTLFSTTSFTNAAMVRSTASGFNSVVVGSTYLVRIYNLSTTMEINYNIGAANQAISNGASCNLLTASSKCLDYLVAGTAAQTDCGSGTYNASQTCTGLALGTVVGRCTLPSATNIGTFYYYSNGGAAFSAGTASTNCSSISNSIFQ